MRAYHNHNSHKVLKSYCVSSVVLSCLNSHFNCTLFSKLGHSISRWIIIVIQIDQEMPGTCKYQKAWGKDYPWVSSVRTDPQSTYCGICLKSFKINSSGVCQLKSHSKCHESGKRKETALNWENQWRQSWVGVLQGEFIGSINRRGNFESRDISSSPYDWKKPQLCIS